MKKIIGLLFALAMILSLAFIGEIATNENPLSAKAQTSVRKKSSGGVYGKSKRGVKYVYRKGKGGVRYVYRKTSKGTVYVGKQSYRGGKWVYNKGASGTKKAYKKTKEFIVGN